MKNILIIGAGIEQVEAIKLAKEMDLYVIVSDMSNKAPGIKYADKFYQISTTDVDGNYKIGKEEGISGVMTVCSETAVSTVASVAKRLKLPGFSESTALRATNKSVMRKVLLNNNVKVSPFIVAKDYSIVLDFVENNIGPWVIKPVDSSGQRGTSIVYNLQSLEKAFSLAKQFSYTDEVLVDKYIVGREVHVTMQVINKQVNFLALSDRITLGDNNFGIAVRHIGPSELSEDLTEMIYAICNKSVEAIKLDNGVATCEIIIENNEAYLMEIAIRVPGGYLREVALYLSGVDIIRTTILDSLGIQSNYNSLITEKQFPAVSVKFISSLNLPVDIKIIRDVNNIEELKDENVKVINLHFTPDFEVPQLSSSVGRFAAIITVGKSREQAINKCENIFNSIKFNNQNLKEYRNYNQYNIYYNSHLE